MIEKKDEQFLKMECLEQILDVLVQILTVINQKNEPIMHSMEVRDQYFTDPVKKRWKNANNSVPKAGDINTMPSKTIPEQALSIPEIMSRYARGLPLEGQRVPVYDEDPENAMPDLSKMDIIDQHETIQAAKEEMYDIASKYKKEQDKKKQDAYDEYKRKYEELDKKFKEQSVKPE